MCFEDDIHVGYDIDLYRIACRLKRGYMSSFLCEGCNRRAISKEEDGTYQIAHVINGEYHWEQLNLDVLKTTKKFHWFTDPISRLFGLN